MNKRLFDLLVILLLSPILFIPLCILAFLILIILGSPVFFVQTRPGLNGKPFKLIKFRSMTSELDLGGKFLPDSSRLTPFGRFLRATSLDELPGLWNVFKGEMSLVGPRPLLLNYLNLYTPYQARRHEVRPGITGWAQVNGRNSLSWDEKFKLDIWYVDNQSFFLDIKILLLTVQKVLLRHDINASKEVTMPEFKGSDERK
jgi:lipopolysaccharide/colanic/teichoic acid biosynthesis glycosyltransferase